MPTLGPVSTSATPRLSRVVSGSAGPTNTQGGETWRNIRYGKQGDRRLPVYEAPDRRQLDEKILIPFGERLTGMERRPQGTDVWLRLGDGDLVDRWVLAVDDGTVNCVRIEEWQEREGRTPAWAFEGQNFPETSMYTEGYAGDSPFCLVSASGDAFWREINIEMLVRDFATSTVFEQQWGGDANFTDWVAYYAANVVLYSGLSTSKAKRLIVTVKHTSRWQNYLKDRCFGPKIEDVGADIGRAQSKECAWLLSSANRLRIKWEEVEFLTAFSFLKEHCKWSPEDCAEAAVHKLQSLAKAWPSLKGGMARAHQLSGAFWSLDEALVDRELEQEDARALWGMVLCWDNSWESGSLLAEAAGAGWLHKASAVVWEEVSCKEKADSWRGSRTPAHYAAAEGHTEIFKLLVDAHADLEVQDECDGMTPAHLAAENGHTGVLQLLVNQGKNLGAKGANLVTPAHTAAANGRAEILRLLYEGRADLGAKDAFGGTPAQWAAERGHAEVLRFLADMNVSAVGDRTLAHRAAKDGNVEVLRLLAEGNADLGAKDGFDDMTPAHHAAGNGHREVLELLLLKKADLGAKDRFGGTPAHWAAATNRTEVLKLLSESRADMSTSDEDGFTPSCRATHYGHTEVVRLLSQGAERQQRAGAAPGRAGEQDASPGGEGQPTAGFLPPDRTISNFSTYLTGPQ